MIYGNWFRVMYPTEELREMLRTNALQSGADPETIEIMEESQDDGWRISWKAERLNG